MPLIYLDNQASTPVDPRVVEVMAPLWAESCGNPHSEEHFAGWSAKATIDRASAQIATALGADASEIVFTSGATEANNLALIGAAAGGSSGHRKRIIVAAIEHKSVLSIARHLEQRTDIEIAHCPVDAMGRVEVRELERLIDSNTLLVSVGSSNGEIGTVQPIAEIGAIVREAGAIMHSDAAQSACFQDLSVLYDNCDLLSLSAHKCYGPKGIGCLVINAGVREKIAPIMFGGGQQGGLRPGTVPVQLAAGFGKSIELVQSDRSSEIVQTSRLRDRLDRLLREKCAGVSTNGPTEGRHPGNLNIRFEGVDAKSLLAAIQPSVAASTGSACTSGQEEPSHVLGAVGLSWAEARECVRFSVGRFNCETEVDQAAVLISEAVGRLRKYEVA